MKKNMIFAALSSLAVVFAVSCIKEAPVATPEGNQVEPGFKEVTLTVGVPTRVNSKDDVLRWNSGAENLAVFGKIGDSMVKYQFTKPKGSKTETSAQFKGIVSENAEIVYALYPYAETDKNCSASAGILSMSLNAHPNHYTVNSIPNETPLYGIISENNITMKSPCAFLKVTLPGDDLKIFKTIRVSAEGCCGNFIVDCTGDIPVVSKGDKDEIYFTPKNNISGNVYVPVLPGTYNDITITIEYTDESGYPVFSKQSLASQTFLSGMFYDCKEVSGAYAESVTAGSCAIEGTSLTMNASAVVWKYSGVTNNAYTAKFFYAEQGIEKGAAGWNEVEAVITGEEGNNVTLSATAAIEAGKSYQYYAQVSDGTNAVESDAVAAVAKVIKEVTFDLTGSGDGVWAYKDPANGENAGAYKIVDENGNDIYPAFYPGVKESNGHKYPEYYYKEWDGTQYGEAKYSESVIPHGMIGGTITKTVDGVDFVVEIGHIPPKAGQTLYYTSWTGLFCAQKSVNIKMICPEEYCINSVTLYCPKGKVTKCNWGIGTIPSSADVVSAENYATSSKPEVNKVLSVSGTVNTPYYLISGDGSNRLSSLTITYEK